jgi:hypothetical protein
MVQAQNISSSTKHAGIYETGIINRLAGHFRDTGYDVIPHAQLNIAWGSILSEVDLLLVKRNALTYVEVKSRRDKFSKALRQIQRMKDYVDYAYVATDRVVNMRDLPNVGLIFVRSDQVTFLKEPKRFCSVPRFSSVVSLKKKCLLRLLGNGDTCPGNLGKYELAQYVLTTRRTECTRECIKEIVTCGETCDTTCPISKFVKQN